MSDLHIRIKRIDGIPHLILAAIITAGIAYGLIFAIQSARVSLIGSIPGLAVLAFFGFWCVVAGWNGWQGIKIIRDRSPKISLTEKGFCDQRTQVVFRWEEFRELRLDRETINGKLVRATLVVMVWRGKPFEIAVDVFRLDHSPDFIARAIRERGIAAHPNSTSMAAAIWDGFPNLEAIKRSIRLLYKNLPKGMIQSFSRSLLNISIDRDCDIVIAVQLLAGVMVRHLKLPVASVIVSFRDMGSPGLVELSAEDDCLVFLHERYRSDHRDIAAILAHEIAHVFLHRHGIWLPDTFENEVLTDTAAIYLGIGWPILNAIRELEEKADYGQQSQTRTTREKLGYLTPDEFGYIVAKRSLAFSDKIDRFVTTDAGRAALCNGYRLAHLDHRSPPLSVCGWYRRLLYYWNRRNHCSVTKDSLKSCVRRVGGYEFDRWGVVFECPVCNQKLRLPLRASLNTGCQVCDATFECST